MDIEKAVLLLESLYDRIERDTVEGKWRLVGALSSQELQALEYVLRHLGAAIPADTMARANDAAPSAPAVVRRISLNTHAASLRSAEDQEVLMCLDFGTAMSKAFAFHTKDETPVDLALGQRSGYTEAVYPLPSSVFVSSAGKVFLGHEAVEKSLEDESRERERYDSPKQELSQGSMGDLSQAALPSSMNPTDTPLFKEEVITLYLAYLTDMAGQELARHGLSRYVRRRFARPCWDAKRTEWAEGNLKRMLARAQILADTFQGRWNGGMDVKDVRSAFDGLNDVGMPSFLVAEGVPEPVAAAASRVISGEPQRLGFMVVDVGAGTTDFGLFVAAEIDPSRPRIIQVKGSIGAVRHAGDTIDGFLRAAILERHGIDVQSAYGRRISVDLGRHIRRYKESLFRNGALRYELVDDIAGTIDLDEFLARQDVGRFGDSLAAKLQNTLDAVDITWIENMFARQGLTLVLTGGGAQLPMVRSLAEGDAESRGFKFRKRLAPDVPVWIGDQYPEFSVEYAQLAVAMGGASPSLPEIVGEIDTFGGGLAHSTVVAGNLPISGS